MHTWRAGASARGVGGLAALVASALLSALVPTSALAADEPTSRWIVVLKNTVTDPSTVAAEQTRPLNAPVREILNLTPGAGEEPLKGYVVEATQGQINTIRTDPRVDFAEPDATVRAPEPPTRPAPLPTAPTRDTRPPGTSIPCTPNDEFFEFQWGLPKIQAPTCAARIKGAVAVLDTGVEFDHPDLAPAVAGHINFSQEPSADDAAGHGTHVAGIIGAVTNNGIGVASVALNTRLYNVKVLNANLAAPISNVVQGLYWVARNAKAKNIRVANMSLTTPTNSQVLRRAVQAAARAGVTLVGAAGNLGTTQVFYPAGYPEVISVAASQEDDTLASFSNRGASSVDLAAPGSNIVSTSANQDYAELSGTSMAAGFVSGVAALCRTTGQCTADYRQTLARLGRDSDPIPGTGTLIRYGRLNASCYWQNLPQCRTAPTGHGKVISKKPLKVRKQPTTRSDVIGSLRPGQTITVECKTKGQRVKGNNIWYKLGEKPRGWASARYVENLTPIRYCPAA